MRKHRDGNANDLLGDDDLLDREEREHREFMRLERLEPNLRDTNYLVLHGPRALTHAWERWNQTGIAARLRGLAPKNTEAQ